MLHAVLAWMRASGVRCCCGTRGSCCDRRHVAACCFRCAVLVLGSEGGECLSGSSGWREGAEREPDVG
eukprot:307391-Prymnesium_polylepis.1